jgi:hypothetical protein
MTMSNKQELLSDDQIRRIMVLQPVYSDDADHAHTVRMGRAIEVATRSEADKWRKRFEWLAMQHWVEPEAEFRLDLADTGDDSAAYMVRLIAAVDARLKTPNVPGMATKEAPK